MAQCTNTNCKREVEDERFRKCVGCRDSHRRAKARARAQDPTKQRGMVADANAKRRARDKTAAISHYGGRCACCGEKEQIFLTIDHIDGVVPPEHHKDGKRMGGPVFYAWLIKNGYPAGLRVLCFNCNFAYHVRGACPHRERDQHLEG